MCVPTYNSATTVARCLGSALAQDGVDFEILVVDDSSADGCADIVNGLLRPRDRLVINDSRLGLAGNHNRCLALARGTYIQFVHADDWLLPGALKSLVAELDGARAGMAFAPRKVVTEDVDFVRRYGTLHANLKGLTTRNDGRALVLQMVARGLHHNWIGEPTCVMFRRQIALDAGGFRDDIYQLLDLDLWLRLMVRTTVCFVPGELSVRSHTAASESVRNKATGRDWLDQLRLLTSMVVDREASPLIRAVSLLWWLPIWLRVTVEGAVLGPQRVARLKTALAAPFTEFGRARGMLGPADARG
ncbi:MAG TPA: glycosyltransferase family 2 protein [Pseudonocardiaceae bacterium]|nr:glycosyltransferase family 2 protein [Pseudonocardiaceae bacterium]